jgi:hypothetical protein
MSLPRPLVAKPPARARGDRSSDGSFVTFHQVAHATVTAGHVSVAFDRPTMVCS